MKEPKSFYGDFFELRIKPEYHFLEEMESQIIREDSELLEHLLAIHKGEKINKNIYPEDELHYDTCKCGQCMPEGFMMTRPFSINVSLIYGYSPTVTKSLKLLFKKHDSFLQGLLKKQYTIASMIIGDNELEKIFNVHSDSWSPEDILDSFIEKLNGKPLNDEWWTRKKTYFEDIIDLFLSDGKKAYKPQFERARDKILGPSWDYVKINATTPEEVEHEYRRLPYIREKQAYINKILRIPDHNIPEDDWDIMKILTREKLKEWIGDPCNWNKPFQYSSQWKYHEGRIVRSGEG